MQQVFKIYRTIDSCPVWNLDRCIKTNDYRYLAILDYYDELPEIEVSKEIYDKLMLEYIDSSESQKTTNYIKDTTYLMSLRNDLVTISNCVNVLSIEFNAEISVILERYLQKQRLNFKYEHSAECLATCISYLEMLKQKFEMKNTEYEKKYKGESKELDMIEALWFIQKHYKQRLNPKDITVREFILMKKDLENEIKKQNGQNRNKRVSRVK